MLLINMRVYWTNCVEHIHFDLAACPIAGEEMFTNEFWPSEKKSVRYKVRVKRFDLDDEKIQFSLSYHLDDNLHLDNQGVSWGTARYEVYFEKKRAVIGWQDEGTENWISGTKSSVRLSGYDREIEQEMTTRIRREASFRKDILQLDACCAITQECMPQALDAAHVLRVGEKGLDDISNGMLLRSDLHRLFDMHYFTFDEDGKICQAPGTPLEKSSGLSEKYLETLAEKSLPPEVLARILPNLRKRNSLFTTGGVQK